MSSPSFVNKHHNVLIGSLCIVCGEFCFTTIGALVKTLSETLSNESIVFFRNIMSLLVFGPIVFGYGISILRTNIPHLHIIRSLSGIGAMYCFFYALGKLPLADAMILKLSAPLFIPIFALFWVKEQANRIVLIAIIIGFMGVLFILHPTGATRFASLVGLLGGALAAFAKVTIRKMSDTEPTIRVVFYFTLTATILSVVPLTWAWTPPRDNEWILIAALGVIATIGQLFLTHAYRTAPAAKVGPFTYSSILFATLFGWLFWNELPTILTFAGAALIICSGILIFRGKVIRKQRANAALAEQEL